MKTFVIEQKMSGTGNINDIASDQFDREIVFSNGCKFAVIPIAYFCPNGLGYSVHKTEKGVIKKSTALWDTSHQIMDDEGYLYEVDHDYYNYFLVKTGQKVKGEHSD